MKLRFVYRAWKARLRDQKLEIEIARVFIQPGDLVIDAGANKGAYLYWLRKFVGENGMVFAYEPQPELVRYLEEICRIFCWRNVHIHSLALSNRAGKSMLHVPGPGISPGASLDSSVLLHTEGRQFECQVDSLDHQLGTRKGLRFLKVDVEGHELALFKGAIETLKCEHPALLFECEGRHLTQHKMGDVFSFLQEFGYSGYLLLGHKLLPVEHFDPAIHQPRPPGEFWNAPNYSNNFLFVSGTLPPSLASRLSEKK
jgi:FkbM family methyltransferase